MTLLFAEDSEHYQIWPRGEPLGYGANGRTPWQAGKSGQPQKVFPALGPLRAVRRAMGFPLRGQSGAFAPGGFDGSVRSVRFGGSAGFLRFRSRSAMRAEAEAENVE